MMNYLHSKLYEGFILMTSSEKQVFSNKLGENKDLETTEIIF
jgi:hypothetical protein